MASAPIRCAKCGKGIGRVAAPDSATLRESMKGSKFAALAYMIPPDIMESVLAPILTFTCTECENGSKEDESQIVIDYEAPAH